MIFHNTIPSGSDPVTDPFNQDGCFVDANPGNDFDSYYSSLPLDDDFYQNEYEHEHEHEYEHEHEHEEVRSSNILGSSGPSINSQSNKDRDNYVPGPEETTFSDGEESDVEMEQCTVCRDDKELHQLYQHHHYSKNPRDSALDLLEFMLQQPRDEILKY